MKKISLIGPVYPWRGGIAHHTNMLVLTFRKMGFLVHAFTFSRQYPKFFYPGKNQRENRIDPLFSSLNAAETIDTINPFSWFKTYRLIVKSGSKVCIFRYWHPYFFIAFSAIAILLRFHKIKIIAIVDNLISHDGGMLDKIAALFFFKFVDLTIVQSEFVLKDFQNIFQGRKKSILCPHPLYDNFGPRVDKNVARETISLGKEKIILLFFGFIRHYKGLDILLETFPKIHQMSPHIHLLIVGECFGSKDVYKELILKHGIEDHVTYISEYVPNDSIPLWFSMADYLVMPYRSATNSGVMEIAKFYGVPVIASDITPFRPYFSNSFIQKANFQDPNSVLSAIRNSGFTNYGHEFLNTWEQFVRTLSVYI